MLFQECKLILPKGAAVSLEARGAFVGVCWLRYRRWWEEKGIEFGEGGNREWWEVGILGKGGSHA
jgi:hypothetical protein